METEDASWLLSEREATQLRAEIARMKQVADIEARVLKEVASGIGDLFPETRRIIEISAARLAALVA